MVNEFWDNLVDQLVNFYHRFVSLNSRLVISANLASQATEVLVTPADQLGTCAQEAELECLIVSFISGHHRDDTIQVCASRLMPKFWLSLLQIDSLYLP